MCLLLVTQFLGLFTSKLRKLFYFHVFSRGLRWMCLEEIKSWNRGTLKKPKQSHTFWKQSKFENKFEKKFFLTSICLFFILLLFFIEELGDSPSNPAESCLDILDRRWVIAGSGGFCVCVCVWDVPKFLAFFSFFLALL